MGKELADGLLLRPSAERGATQIGWLDSRHSFSFGGYRDPAHMGFGPLRVLNDDRVAPGGGFAEHGHRDMEILSWVVDGGLAHKDSMGSVSTLRPGTAQLMSAGSGVRHSEFNASDTEPVRFLQVWIEPDHLGEQPRYGELVLEPDQRSGAFARIAAPAYEAHELGALPIGQDARVLVGDFGSGEAATYPVGPGRRAWVQVVVGSITVNGQAMREGDGLAITGADAVEVSDGLDAQVLLFDLPGRS
ncbi:MAG: pirin family protein [Planctomycetota bacterium]